MISRCLLLIILFFSAANAAVAPTSDLQLPDLTGNPQKLSEYRGTIVILNFWATWCVPCRKEMPLFVKLQNQYASSGVQFIGVSIDEKEDAQKVADFAQKYKINFPIWLNGTIERQAEFGLGTSVPATAIIDRNGKICFRIIGESKERDLIQRINYLLSASNQKKAPESLMLPPGITREHFEKHHAQPGMEQDHDHHEDTASSGSEVPS